jgi:hypothetical protein
MGRNLTALTGVSGQNIGLGNYSSYSLSGQASSNITIGYQSMYNATDCSSNIVIGVNSGNSITTGGGNICIGGSSTSTASTLTNGAGLNVGIGTASNLYISTNANQNIGIGGYSNFNTSTGCSNISIGTYTQALSATGCNQITISTNGTSGTPISGKGDNTALIDSRSGLFSYLPAFWWGYAGNQTGGIVGWIKFGSRNMDLKSTDNTQLIFPYIGWWEVNVSGGVYIGNINQNFNLYLNGGLYITNANYFNTAVGWTSASSSVLIQVVSVNSYFQIAIAGSMTLSGSVPLILTAKFISL